MYSLDEGQGLLYSGVASVLQKSWWGWGAGETNGKVVFSKTCICNFSEHFSGEEKPLLLLQKALQMGCCWRAETAFIIVTGSAFYNVLRQNIC